MMNMMLTPWNNQPHVLYHKMFLFNSIMKAIRLHITITKKKVLKQLKGIPYLYAFLLSNCWKKILKSSSKKKNLCLCKATLDQWSRMTRCHNILFMLLETLLLALKYNHMFTMKLKTVSNQVGKPYHYVFLLSNYWRKIFVVSQDRDPPSMNKVVMIILWKIT